MSKLGNSIFVANLVLGSNPVRTMHYKFLIITIKTHDYLAYMHFYKYFYCLKIIHLTNPAKTC